MALIVLIVMAALTILAVKCKESKPLFAAVLGVLTFMIFPLWGSGDVPLKARLVFGLLYAWYATLPSAVLAVVVYGGIGLVVHHYVQTSRDVRWIRMVVSALIGAMLSGIVYHVLMRFFATGIQMTYGGLAQLLGVGALVALVVAFALTHERPRNCPFLESRDGGTVLAALLGAGAVMGGLNIAAQALPPGYPMRQLVLNLILGALLGAGLTVPLRALGQGRVVRAALGAVIGAVVLKSVSSIGAAALQGFVAGALVGALLTDGQCGETAIVAVGEPLAENGQPDAESDLPDEM